MIKNKWVIRDNPTSVMVSQYLKYSKCKTLDDLINLPLDKTTELINDYMFTILSINTDNVVVNKMVALEYFYEVNEIKIILKGHIFEIPTIERVVVMPLSEF